MSENQNPRQVGRTYLIEALVRLGQKKEISRITVTELCSKAGVNRTTFYKYFIDMPDLIEGVAQEFLDQTFYKSIQETQAGRPTHEVLASVLEASRKTKDLTLLILKEAAFEPVRDRLYQEITRTWMASLPQQTTKDRLHLAYFHGGATAFWRQWIVEDQTVSAEEAAKDLQVLLNQAMRLGGE